MIVRRVSHKVGNDGFSLVEMLVVLVIIGAGAGIAFMSVDALTKKETVFSVAHDISALMSRSRDNAMLKGMRTLVSVDIFGKSLTSSPGGELVALPKDIRIAVTFAEEAVSQAGHPAIVFLADGSSSGIEITLSDQQGRTANVRTNWLTGLTSDAIVQR